MMSWGINVSEQGWRKGPWTPEEDKLLSEYVTLHGEGRWSSVARCAGLNRSGKSCRLRWVNYLRPGLKRGQITPQEEGIIIELHALWGNKWSTIARYLPGRTDNEIKNFWRTHFKKKGKSSQQNQLMQKRRSQILKGKLQRDKLQAKGESEKTTPLVVSPQMGVSTEGEAKTTSISTDHRQEIIKPQNYNNMPLITNPTSVSQANPVVYQDESTALFPWSDAVADQEYGLWGGLLWNLDDINYYGCARTDKLATQNNINNQAIITGHVNSYYGSGDINYPNKDNNIVPNIQNQARAFSSCNGGYIF